MDRLDYQNEKFLLVKGTVNKIEGQAANYEKILVIYMSSENLYLEWIKYICRSMTKR